jgi:hypothetical protein
MDIDIFAKSSSNPELPYKVNFTIKEGIMNVHCSCPAGIRGQLCKHKTSFIEGDYNMLYDILQQPLLNDIVAIINASPLKKEYSRFKYRKMEIEKMQRELKRELKDIKINLAAKLQNGIKT